MFYLVFTIKKIFTNSSPYSFYILYYSVLYYFYDTTAEKTIPRLVHRAFSPQQ